MTDLEALSKPTELQFINPLALKRGQRVPAGNLFSNSDAFVTFPFRASMSERKIGVEEKRLVMRLQKEKKRKEIGRLASRKPYGFAAILDISEQVGRSTCYIRKKKKVQTGRIACHLSATSDTP